MFFLFHPWLPSFYCSSHSCQSDPVKTSVKPCHSAQNVPVVPFTEETINSIQRPTQPAWSSLPPPLSMSLSFQTHSAAATHPFCHASNPLGTFSMSRPSTCLSLPQMLIPKCPHDLLPDFFSSLLPHYLPSTLLSTYHYQHNIDFTNSSCLLSLCSSNM